LGENSKKIARARRRGDGLFSVVAVGAVLILIGIVFASTPNIFNDVGEFFSDFTVVQVPDMSISLAAPAHPANHAELYGAVALFSLGVGVLQILMLALRLVLSSPIGKTAETVGNLVFWFGTSYLIMTLLNSATTLETWFAFWAATLVVLGASMIARALVLFPRR